MKRIFRYTLALSVLAAIVVITATALGVSGAQHKARACTSVNITIKDSTRSRFVNKADVMGYLDKDYGKCTGKPVDSLNLKRIEEIIDSKSAVLKSEAYVTSDGTLNIDVTQRKPLIRFQRSNGGFYCDSEGYLFPLKSNYTSYVTIVDGEIPLKVSDGYKGEGSSDKEKEWIRKMTELVTYMLDHKVWANDIVQINVRSNGDLVLVPREGREKFIFGKPDSIEEKFKLMTYYYTSIVPYKGKDYYSSVNIKYDGQIICRK